MSHTFVLVEGEENKLTTFSAWTIMLGCTVHVVVLCVCVCLSVPALAAFMPAYICNQRYSQVFLRLFLDYDSCIFEKKMSFKSYGVEKLICKLDRAHREPFSQLSTSGLQERQLVDRVLLQTLVTVTTGV